MVRDRPLEQVSSTFRGELKLVATTRPGVWYLGGEQFYAE